MDKQIVWCSSPPQHYSQFVSDACAAWIESWIFSDDRKIHSGKANTSKEHWSEMSRCISYWFNGDIPASYVIVSSRGHHGFLTGDESHQGDESYQGYVWSGRYLDPSPGAVGRTGDALKVWDAHLALKNAAWKQPILSYFGFGNEFQGRAVKLFGYCNNYCQVFFFPIRDGLIGCLGLRYFSEDGGSTPTVRPWK